MLELIRHAKTAGNIERRYVGWTDDPIVATDLPIIDNTVEAVYCSDLVRTQQTAQAYFPHATQHVIADFRETHFGDFEMKTYDQLKDDVLYRQWIDEPTNVAPPNGESLTDFYARVRRGMQQLRGACHYVAVLHGGTIRALLVDLAPTPSAFWDWHVGHDVRFQLKWSTQQAFEEGERCTSLSVVPLTANART